MRAKALKLLEENLGESLMTLNLAVIYWTWKPNAQTAKEKIDKLEYINI